MLRRVLTASACLLLLACGAGGGDDSDGGASASGSTGGASDSVGSMGTATPSSSTVGSGGDTSGGTTASTSGASAVTSADPATSADPDTSGGSGSEDSTGGDTSGGDESSSGGDESSSGGDVPLSDDPFDPAACNGVAWTAEEALAQLGGAERLQLASATIVERTRTCAGEDCGEWGPNEDWYISYLTWSGGVVTAYTDLEAAMNLVLFDDGGTARLSMQHETFAAGDYPDDDGVLYGFPPQVVNYPHLRAFNEFPESEYYYIDLDYQVAQGVMVLGEGCAVWTANPYGTGQPYTAQYGAVFHW